MTYSNQTSIPQILILRTLAVFQQIGFIHRTKGSQDMIILTWLASAGYLVCDASFVLHLPSGSEEDSQLVLFSIA